MPCITESRGLGLLRVRIVLEVRELTMQAVYAWRDAAILTEHAGEMALRLEAHAARDLD